MALKVCAIEVTADIGDLPMLPEEDGIFCLVTCHGQPLGDLLINSAADSISAELLKEKIARKFGWSIFERHLQAEFTGEVEPPLPSRIRNTSGALPTVSVVICTRDRPDDLCRCLQSMRTLEYPFVEVLVVDNGSRDGETRRAALEHGVRYVREDKAGLDFARNRGIAESTGEFIAFADDDVLVDSRWVDWLLRGFEDESIVCVTGLTMPLELAHEPQLFFERYGSGGFRRGYQKRIFDRLILPPAAAGKVGAGANMAFRREIFDHIGRFDEALDCGTPAQAGGEFEMFYRILAGGYRICYQPAALSWHKHRSTMPELERQIHGYGIAVYAVFSKLVLEYRDWQALRIGVSYFLRHLLRQAVRSALGKNSLPFRLTFTELLGSFRGPRAYFASKAYASRLREREGLERRRPDGGRAHFVRTMRRIGRSSRAWTVQ